MARPSTTALKPRILKAVPLGQGNPLRKHAYSNILKFLPPINENFQMKISDNFRISAQNIDCEYSLEPPH